MKKKWFYIVSIIIASALVITGVVFLFVINYGGAKPEAVTISTSNSKTYVKTNLNDNQYGYIYKFENVVDKQDVYLHSSTNNMICADNLIEEGSLTLGEKYNISVCYKNEFENGYTNFSEPKQWLASQFLQAPTIFVIPSFDVDEEGDEYLMWDSIENADKYLVYYSYGSERLLYETTHTSVDLGELEGGQHTFYVIASSNQEKYIDSAMSNTESATSYHKIKPFLSAQFDKGSKRLIINSPEDMNDIEIYVGTNQNDAQKYNYSYQSGGTTFTKKQIAQGIQFIININAIYSNETTYIAVRPNPSGYNVYTGDLSVAIIV